jgi:hypothetical protein
MSGSIRPYDLEKSVGSSQWATQGISRRCQEIVTPERLHAIFVGVREDEEMVVYTKSEDDAFGDIGQSGDEHIVCGAGSPSRKLKRGVHTRPEQQLVPSQRTKRLSPSPLGRTA